MNDHNDSNEAVILSAVRTPMGRFQGCLGPLTAPQLGAAVVREAVRRAGVDPGAIDEVIMGDVVTAGIGQAPARQAALFGGLPDTTPATTVNKVCGSGLKACMFAAQAIRAGDAQVLVAGGMESMSQTPFLLHARTGLRYGHNQLVDALLHDGLWDPFENWAMGMAAEYIADRHEVTREAMDRFSLASHQRAVAAIDSGKFKDEIVPVEVPGKGGTKTIAEVDETPRRDTTLDKLAALKPAFKPDGRVTAGNAPGLNDGAAALVLASRSTAESLGVKPLARVLAYTQAAVPPKDLFIAPARALPKLLKRLGWRFADVDLMELNEAFAAQVLADGYALAEDGWDWDWDKVNVNGGAIALGHPIGASGARILTTLLYALRDRGLRRGIASLCLGGGEAVAMAVEIED
ncbi:MAG TPA: acetyl-CoA C-acetyltransferase [Anaerolineales bacterium]|nr:acetyl-CoA C-acetyltransferase [Anaerolineales bacterium]